MFEGVDDILKSASNVAYQPFLIFFATVITESYLKKSLECPLMRWELV